MGAHHSKHENPKHARLQKLEEKKEDPEAERLYQLFKKFSIYSSSRIEASLDISTKEAHTLMRKLRDIYPSAKIIDQVTLFAVTSYNIIVLVDCKDKVIEDTDTKINELIDRSIQPDHDFR